MANWTSIAHRWSWVLLLIPIYLFIFLKLDSFHVRLWDESYFAVHATEMLLNDSWLVPYFDGHPAEGGTKPPLQSWLQIIMMKLIGINELALRLPSAIAAGATVLVVFHFARHEFGSIAAWTAAFALLTFGGFIHFHTGRGMESDALLALTLLAQVVLFAKFLATNRIHFLYLTGLFVGIAFLVKSIAGFLFVPGILLYLVFFERGRLSVLLKSRHLYAAMGVGLFLPGMYLVLRELMHPGFSSFIVERHLGKVVESQGDFSSPFYYFSILSSGRFILWTSIALGSIAHTLYSRQNRTAILVSVIALTLLLVLNLTITKFEHYLNPLAPLFAIMVGVLATRLFSETSKTLTVLSLAFVFALPSYGMFMKSQSNYMDQGQIVNEASAKYLHRAIREGKDLSGLQVLHYGFDAAILYYTHRYESIGQHIEINNWSIYPDDTVLTCDPNYQRTIENMFMVDTIDQLENAIVYHLKARRNE